jgi:hypothetical protein
MFTTQKSRAIWGLRKKVFTEFKYFVICEIVYDLLAKVFNLTPTPIEYRIE